MEAPFRRERRRPVAEMNVVPYIDVMLVLLVIFMVTAPMLTQGIQVELPKAVTDNLSLQSREPIILSIKEDDSYWIKQGNSKDQLVSPEEITTTVQSALEKTPDVPVLVNGDHRVRYGTVIVLMAKLQQAGVPNVGLLTQAEPDVAR